MASKTVLIAGYGSAGQYVVDFLLKDHRIPDASQSDKSRYLTEIAVMSRKSEAEVNPRLEISRVAAGLSNRHIDLTYHQCDFDDIDKMTEIINELTPNVIVYTGRYAPGLKYGSFSYPRDIGYGVWMPMSVPYIYNLMKAVNQSKVKYSCKVINTSFPDGVNMLLDQNSLAPFCGAGNVNHLIPRIKKAASKVYSIPSHQIGVELIGSHYLNTYVSKEGTDRRCPSHLKIFNLESGEVLYDDSKVPHSCNPTKDEIYRESRDDSAGGQIRNQMIATDCAEIVRLLLRDLYSSDESETIHVPGVLGLPGGLPVKISRDNVIFTDCDYQLVKYVNNEGLRRDGVIVRDGGIEFTEEVRDKMKTCFDLDYPVWIHLTEVRALADKIRDKLVNM